MRPLILLLAIGCAGCGDGRPPAPATSHDGAERRIVTLAPHLAELVFAVGAGDALVGVSAYSNYPPAVGDLPVVGDAFAVDQERLALLEPDLLLAWASGTPAHIVDELEARGFRVAVLQTQNLADVATALRRIGNLTGREAAAERAANAFENGIAALRERWRDAEPIRVFYQVSQRPLYTVNGDHYLSELIALCGGRNVFAALDVLAPAVGEEAVLERDPEVLLAPAAGDGADALDVWERWPALAAVRDGNRFYLPADLAGRATPRLIEAGHTVCDALQRGREQRTPGHSL